MGGNEGPRHIVNKVCTSSRSSGQWGTQTSTDSGAPRTIATLYNIGEESYKVDKLLLVNDRSEAKSNSHHQLSIEDEYR
jgi:hypothetical protein